MNCRAIVEWQPGGGRFCGAPAQRRLTILTPYRGGRFIRGKVALCEPHATAKKSDKTFAPTRR